MRPYRCKEFVQMWKGLENSKSIKKGKAFLVRREADAAEGILPTQAVAPALGPSVPSIKARNGENDNGRRRSAPATEESRRTAPPTKKQARLDISPKQNRQTKTARAPATAGPTGPTRRFRIGDLVWYFGDPTYPMWPGQIKKVDEANQQYLVDSFGDDWEYVGALLEATSSPCRPADIASPSHGVGLGLAQLQRVFRGGHAAVPGTVV